MDQGLLSVIVNAGFGGAVCYFFWHVLSRTLPAITEQFDKAAIKLASVVDKITDTFRAEINAERTFREMDRSERQRNVDVIVGELREMHFKLDALVDRLKAGEIVEQKRSEGDGGSQVKLR